MAECPKCHTHLRLIDWKQKCPYCGANIVLYDLQERLMCDADKAEVQYYYFQKKLDRVKASFVGTKPAIIRIFTSLLPLGPLFLPLAKIKMSAPFPEHDGNMSILDAYKLFSDVNIKGVAAELTKGGAPFVISVACLLLSLILLLLHFILLTLSCSPKGKVRNYTQDIILLILTIGAAVSFMFIPDGYIVSGSLSYGTYLYIALMIVNFVMDIIVMKKGIPVTHKQCYVGGIPIEEYFELVEKGTPHDELRAEMYKRLNEMQAEKDRELAEKEAKEKKNEEANSNGGE